MTLKNFFLFLVLIITTQISSSTYSGDLKKVKIGQIVKLNLGSFALSKSNCVIDVTVNGMGGSHDLSVRNVSSGAVLLEPVIDVTAWGWISNDLLVFSVAPIYGKPGICKFSCTDGTMIKLVAAKTISKAYPDGADFFELQRLDAKNSIIYYYYHPDIGATSLNQDKWTRNDLYSIDTDGAYLSKVK